MYLTENPTGRGLSLFRHTSISESGGGLLVQAGIVVDAGEGALQALLANPTYQPVGHFAICVDGGQRLHERLTARLTLPAAGIQMESRFAVSRHIADDCSLRPWPISRSEPQVAQVVEGFETSE